MEQLVNEETVNLEQMTLILKNMDEAACMTAKNGLLLFANSALLKLFGFDEDAIGTKKIWESIPYVEQNDDLIQLFIDGVSGEEKTAQNLVDYVNNDGESYKLWVNLIYMPDDGGNFVIVINDVTKQVKVNDAFVRYTSPEIADFILNSPNGEEQGGESRDVSILMSDLRAFTSMSSELEASKLITMLNHYFEKMVEELDSYTNQAVISFIDLYEKTKKNFSEVKEVDIETQIEITKKFVEIGKRHGIEIYTCHENEILGKYGANISGCMTKEVLERAINYKLKVKNRLDTRQGCNCLLGNDIGAYNTCGHLCRYCYANYSKEKVMGNMKKHDPDSPLLIGNIEKDDVIRQSRQISYLDKQLSLF